MSLLLLRLLCDDWWRSLCRTERKNHDRLLTGDKWFRSRAAPSVSSLSTSIRKDDVTLWRQASFYRRRFKGHGHLSATSFKLPPHKLPKFLKFKTAKIILYWPRTTFLRGPGLPQNFYRACPQIKRPHKVWRKVWRNENKFRCWWRFETVEQTDVFGDMHRDWVTCVHFAGLRVVWRWTTFIIDICVCAEQHTRGPCCMFSLPPADWFLFPDKPASIVRVLQLTGTRSTAGRPDPWLLSEASTLRRRRWHEASQHCTIGTVTT